jgi:hypothetical protein
LHSFLSCANNRFIPGMSSLSKEAGSLTDKRIDDLQKRLSHDLECLAEYERLVGRQEKLIEKGDFERLVKALDKKTNILSKIRTLNIGAARAEVGAAGGDGRKNGKNAEVLLASFTTKIEELVAREEVSLKQARVGKTQLAEQLKAIKRGKKLLRGYKPQRSDGKARFKDIKT